MSLYATDTDYTTTIARPNQMFIPCLCVCFCCFFLLFLSLLPFVRFEKITVLTNAIGAIIRMNANRVRNQCTHTHASLCHWRMNINIFDELNYSKQNVNILISIHPFHNIQFIQFRFDASREQREAPTNRSIERTNRFSGKHSIAERRQVHCFPMKRKSGIW